MKDEKKKIIQSISDFYKLDNALKYYLDRHKAQILLDYITNLQEEIHKKEAMYDSLAVDYRLLQEENERYKNIVDEVIEYIKRLEKDYDINVWVENKHWAYILMKLEKLKGSDK